MYSCCCCDKMFIFQDDLDAHGQASHPFSQLISCHLCSSAFLNYVSFYNHFQNHGEPSINIKCQICNYTSENKVSYLIHLRQHISKADYYILVNDPLRIDSFDVSEQFETSIEDPQFPLTESLSEHFLGDILLPNSKSKPTSVNGLGSCIDTQSISDASSVHSDSLQNFFYCRECRICLSSGLALIKHRRAMHHTKSIQTDSMRRLQCPKCPRVTNSFINLRAHLLKVHHIFVCKICKEEFTSLSAIRNHSVFSHNGDGGEDFTTDDEAYMCPICSSVHTDSAALDVHLNLEHAEQMTCAICCYQATKLEDYLNHKEEHGEIVKCKICSKEVMCNSLNSHMRSLHNQFTFLCIKCGKAFSNAKRLTAHSEDVHDTPIFMCPYPKCGKIFSSHTRLRSHKSVHLTALLSCRVCFRTFRRKCMLKIHLKKHEEFDIIARSNDQSTSCSECKLKFTSVASLRRHEITHRIKKHCCNSCSKRFHTRVAYMEHILNRHRGEFPETDDWIVFKCDICGFLSVSRGRHFKHLRSHSDIKVTCENCGKVLKNTSSLASHRCPNKVVVVENNRKVIRTRADKAFACTECDKSYTAKKNLLNHLKTHSDADLACPICQKMFHVKNNLVSHILTHTNSDLAAEECNFEEFRCIICQTVFPHFDDLKSHYSSSHGRKSLVCEICHKMYAYKDTYNAHMVSHRDLLPRDHPIILKYCHTCNTCGKVFNNSRNLARHVNSHKGKKIVHCKICNKQFTNSAKLEAHSSLHTSTESFDCRLCDALFETKLLLTAHLKIQHAGAANTIHCPAELCNKTFFDKSNYLEHVSSHNPNGKFVCQFCSHVITGLGNHNHHERIHTQSQNIIRCPYCPKLFTSNRVAEAHCASAHPQRPLTACEECGYLAISNLALQLHQQITHRDSKNPSAKEQLNCSHSINNANTVVIELTQGGAYFTGGTILNIDGQYKVIKECLNPQSIRSDGELSTYTYSLENPDSEDLYINYQN